MKSVIRTAHGPLAHGMTLEGGKRGGSLEETYTLFQAYTHRQMLSCWTTTNEY